MKIHIQTLAGTTLPLDLEEGVSIDWVQTRIREAWGAPTEQQSLVYQGVQLRPGTLLYDYNVTPDATIRLTLRRGRRAPTNKQTPPDATRVGTLTHEERKPAAMNDALNWLRSGEPDIDGLHDPGALAKMLAATLPDSSVAPPAQLDAVKRTNPATGTDFDMAKSLSGGGEEDAEEDEEEQDEAAKNLQWEKPAWTQAKLKTTTKGAKITPDKQLSAPISNIPNKIDQGAEEKEGADNRKEYAFEKPSRVRTKQFHPLKTTEIGKQQEEGEDVSDPIEEEMSHVIGEVEVVQPTEEAPVVYPGADIAMQEGVVADGIEAFVADTVVDATGVAVVMSEEEEEQFEQKRSSLGRALSDMTFGCVQSCFAVCCCCKGGDDARMDAMEEFQDAIEDAQYANYLAPIQPETDLETPPEDRPPAPLPAPRSVEEPFDAGGEFDEGDAPKPGPEIPPAEPLLVPDEEDEENLGRKMGAKPDEDEDEEVNRKFGAEFDLGLLDDDTYKVKILRQKVIGFAEVFLYKVPRDKGPGQQYFANEWNLKRPLNVCSLRMERRGDALLLLFTYVQDGAKVQGSTLFALCRINGNQDMDDHVLTVGDSSRHFVVRVRDEKGDREALVGLGFREHDEAADFQTAISHYVNAVLKEKTARQAQEDENMEPEHNYQRKLKPEPVYIDPRKQRKQMGLGDGQVWDALDTSEEEQEKTGNVAWVIGNGLTAFAGAEDTGDLIEEGSLSEQEMTDKEITENEEEGYDYPQPSRSQGKFKEEILGISVHWLKYGLMEEVYSAGLNEHATIHDLENLKSNTGPCLIRSMSRTTVCPVDGRTGAAYVHCLGNDKDKVGVATHMLSYTWSYLIGDIVEALCDFCGARNLDPKRTYIWMDCICINQHRVVEQKSIGGSGMLNFQEEFPNKLARIGHMLAMTLPWHAPIYLKRIWCIFELYAAHIKGCKIDIIMPPKERLAMGEALGKIGTQGIDQLYLTLGNTRVEDAMATLEEDRTRILKMVESGPGYKALNMKVNDLLRQWVRETTIEFVQDAHQRRVAWQTTAAPRTQMTVDQPMERSVVKADNQQKQPTADFTTALSNRGSGLLASDSEVANFMSNAGVFLHKNAETEQALECHKMALDLYALEGTLPGTAAAHSNIGSALLGSGNLDEAFEQYQRSLSIRESTLGTDCSETAASLNNIALVLLEKANYCDALMYANKAIAILRRLGSDQDSVVAAMSYYIKGLVLLKQGDLDGALGQSQKALGIQELVLGIYHPDTAGSYHSVGHIMQQLGDRDGAIEYLENGLAIRECLFGSAHPETVESRRILDSGALLATQ